MGARACEYLGHEVHITGPHAGHHREFCAYTLEACLIDDPLGYLNCTRRTWLMLQSAEPEPDLPPLRKRKVIAKEEAKLLWAYGEL
jgi:hypothetical protein